MEVSIFCHDNDPLAAGLAKNLGKKMGKATVQASETSGKLVSFLSDIFRASKMIKFTKEEAEEKTQLKLFHNWLIKISDLASLIIRATPIMETLTGIMIAGFIFTLEN